MTKAMWPEILGDFLCSALCVIKCLIKFFYCFQQNKMTSGSDNVIRFNQFKNKGIDANVSPLYSRVVQNIFIRIGGGYCFLLSAEIKKKKIRGQRGAPKGKKR